MEPSLLLTDEKWARVPVVVFDTDTKLDCIPSEWIDDEYLLEGNNETRDEIRDRLWDEMNNENSTIDECWADRHILRCGNDFYRYDEGGNATYLGHELPELDSQP